MKKKIISAAMALILLSASVGWPRGNEGSGLADLSDDQKKVALLFVGSLTLLYTVAFWDAFSFAHHPSFRKGIGVMKTKFGSNELEFGLRPHSADFSSFRSVEMNDGFSVGMKLSISF